MRLIAGLLVVCALSSVARADDELDVEAALEQRSASAIDAMLADSVRVGPILFEDAACRKRFATPALVTGAERQKVADCLAKVSAMPERMGLIPALPLAWRDTATHALFVATMADHRIAAIGPFDPQKDDAGLPTVESSSVWARFKPSNALGAKIRAAAHKPSVVVKSCAKGKAKITSRIAIGSGTAAFDEEAKAYLAHLSVDAKDVATNTCAVWVLAPAPTVKDIVQPIKIEKQAYRDDNGVEGGEEGGIADDLGGPPPPAPPPPSPSQNIAPSALENLRIAGTKAVEPNPDTKKQIAADGRAKVIGSFKLCISGDGYVTTVSVLKSTGYDAYDAKLRLAMDRWKFKPYLVNGRATPVCTAETFIFSP